MTLGRRIAGSFVTAAALSLALMPGAAADPAAGRTTARAHDHRLSPGTGLTVVCQLDGTPKGRAGALSEVELVRLAHAGKITGRSGGSRCLVPTGSTGERIVLVRDKEAPPASADVFVRSSGGGR